MAIYSMTYDSKTEKASFTKDGVNIPDVVSMSVRQDWDDEDDYMMFVETSKKVEDEEGDSEKVTITYTRASEKPLDETKVVADIAKYFGLKG